MNMHTANLRISYLGGGYDYPKFFEHSPVTIISEGLPIGIQCEMTAKGFEWTVPEGLGSGLGSSAARHLSFIRTKFPKAPWRDQIDTAIQLDGLQAGGWQDVIASAYRGLIKIVLHRKDWDVYPLMDTPIGLRKYRRLYRIPIAIVQKNILIAMSCRESSFPKMQELVSRGIGSLEMSDMEGFGRAVRDAWELKKRWHPDITNATITEMETAAEAAGAWGYKTCGAGGQGYLLVIGDEKCHEQMRGDYQSLEVDGV